MRVAISSYGFKRRADERGIALAFVMIVLLLLSVMVISAHYTMVTHTESTANYRDAMQAYYTSQAGIERTIDWFSHKYNPPDWAAASLNDRVYPNLLPSSQTVVLSSEGADSTFPYAAAVSGSPNSFQEYLQNTNPITSQSVSNLEGRYIVKATLLSTKLIDVFPSGKRRVERWRIESNGIWRNSVYGNELARSENLAVIETLVGPGITHAICSNRYDMNGMPPIDSYDSTLGAYGGSNLGGAASLGSYNDSTGPFDFGNVSIDGAIDIPPSYHSAPDAEPCNQATQGCGINYCPDYPPIPPFAIGLSGSSPYKAYSTDDCVFTPGGPGSCPSPEVGATGREVEGGTITLADAPHFTGSGAASFWAEEIGDGVLIDNETGRTGDGPLNIFVDRIDGSISIRNRAPSEKNPVNIFVRSNVRMKGTDSINSSAGLGVNTAGLKLFLAPSVTFTLSGNPNITGIIYGPDLSTDIGNGQIDFYGTVIAGTLFRKNGTSGGIHYDRRLESIASTVYNFMPNAEVRRIF